MYSSKHEKDRIGSLDGKILSTDIADFPGKTILKHNDIVQWDIYKQTWVTGQLVSFPQIQANQQSIVDLSNNTGVAIQNAINNVVLRTHKCCSHIGVRARARAARAAQRARAGANIDPTSNI